MSSVADSTSIAGRIRIVAHDAHAAELGLIEEFARTRAGSVASHFDQQVAAWLNGDRLKQTCPFAPAWDIVNRMGHTSCLFNQAGTKIEKAGGWVGAFQLNPEPGSNETPRDSWFTLGARVGLQALEVSFERAVKALDGDWQVVGWLERSGDNDIITSHALIHSSDITKELKLMLGA